MAIGIMQAAANLGTAVTLGAVIGFERQWRQRFAGLRTNTLVAGRAINRVDEIRYMSRPQRCKSARSQCSAVAFRPNRQEKNRWSRVGIASAIARLNMHRTGDAYETPTSGAMPASCRLCVRRRNLQGH